MLTDITNVGPPSGVNYFSFSYALTAPRLICSECVIILIRFLFIRISSYYNASALCTWLRHLHVTASMPRSQSGCVNETIWTYKIESICIVLMSDLIYVLHKCQN